MSEQETPPFDEEDVRRDFEDAIDAEVMGNLGFSDSRLSRYDWPETEDDNDSWPFVVVRDGREFEVDIDIRVTELTPERKAARQADHERILAAIAARKVQR